MDELSAVRRQLTRLVLERGSYLSELDQDRYLELGEREMRLLEERRRNR
jgi:hypothetical protein